MEKFNPLDPKFKKVSDLPAKQKGNFVNDSKGGFIRKEATENDGRLGTMAADANHTRTFFDRITGRNKTSVLDLAQEEASQLDSFYKEHGNNKEITDQEYSELLNLHPEVGPYLRRLSNPDISIEDAFRLVGEFNDKYAIAERAGFYTHYRFPNTSPRINVSVKYFKNGRLSLSVRDNTQH